MCLCPRERFAFGVCGASTPEILDVEKRCGHAQIIWEHGIWHLKERSFFVLQARNFSECSWGNKERKQSRG